MLDMNMFREHADLIRADHTKRGLPHDAIERVIELDKTWRNLLHETDQLRRSKNEAARGIGAAKKAGDDEAAQAILAQVADLGAQISEMEAQPDEAVALVREGSTGPLMLELRLRLPFPIGTWSGDAPWTGCTQTK